MDLTDEELRVLGVRFEDLEAVVYSDLSFLGTVYKFFVTYLLPCF